MGTLHSFNDLNIGDTIGPLYQEITADSVTDFCKVYGNSIPNRFTDMALAKKAGLNFLMVPGVMNIAYMAKLITNWFPASVLKSLDVIFRQPVPHGTINISALVTDKYENTGENLINCDIYISNEVNGKLVTGVAKVAMPILDKS